MQTISAVETALAQSHPGFFDMSLQDMDLYLLGLKKSATKSTSMDIAPDTITTELSAPSFEKATLSHLQESNLTNQHVTYQESPDEAMITQDDTPFSPVKPTKLSKPQHDSEGNPFISTADVDSSKSKATKHSSTRAKRRTVIKNVVRVETRWAPKDFNELRSSSEKMYGRLAPILSCFNNDHSRIMEWQTNQMEATPDLDQTQPSKYLSIIPKFLKLFSQKTSIPSSQRKSSGSLMLLLMNPLVPYSLQSRLSLAEAPRLER